MPRPRRGEPDELRALSSEGLEQARALGEALAASAGAPRARALEPAAARAADRRPRSAAPRGRRYASTRRSRRARPRRHCAIALEGERGPVATVGHQPDCSEIALALIGRDPGFPVAGMVELELVA